MTPASRSTALTFIVFVAGFVLGHVLDAGLAQSQEPQVAKVFEMRTYTTPEGKLPNLLARFRDHTLRIFENHGISNVGYWVPEDQANTLIYIISHESRTAAAENWGTFRNDPEWRQVSEESQRDGRIVSNVESVFMNATDFSPIE